MKKTEKIINYDNLPLILSILDQLIFYINKKNICSIIKQNMKNQIINNELNNI